jgi:hypothetical protein
VSGVDFERVDPELAFDDPPAVSVDGNAITVRGTIQHASSSCGTVTLAHTGYERSQERVDLLVVAGDNDEDRAGCTDDLVTAGYRAEVTVTQRVRRVAATEHHVFGDTYSTTDVID